MRTAFIRLAGLLTLVVSKRRRTRSWDAGLHAPMPQVPVDVVPPPPMERLHRLLDRTQLEIKELRRRRDGLRAIERGAFREYYAELNRRSAMIVPIGAAESLAQLGGVLEVERYARELHRPYHERRKRADVGLTIDRLTQMAARIRRCIAALSDDALLAVLRERRSVDLKFKTLEEETAEILRARAAELRAIGITARLTDPHYVVGQDYVQDQYVLYRQGFWRFHVRPTHTSGG